MSNLDFTRRDPPDLPKLEAVPKKAPPFEPPPGKSHWQYLMEEARDKLDEGKTQDGYANVAHASRVAALASGEDPDTVDRLFREVVGGVWRPDPEAA